MKHVTYYDSHLDEMANSRGTSHTSINFSVTWLGFAHINYIPIYQQLLVLTLGDSTAAQDDLQLLPCIWHGNTTHKDINTFIIQKDEASKTHSYKSGVKRTRKLYALSHKIRGLVGVEGEDSYDLNQLGQFPHPRNPHILLHPTLLTWI